MLLLTSACCQMLYSAHLPDCSDAHVLSNPVQQGLAGSYLLPPAWAQIPLPVSMWSLRRCVYHPARVPDTLREIIMYTRVLSIFEAQVVHNTPTTPRQTVSQRAHRVACEVAQELTRNTERRTRIAWRREWLGFMPKTSRAWRTLQSTLKSSMCWLEPMVPEKPTCLSCSSLLIYVSTQTEFPHIHLDHGQDSKISYGPVTRTKWFVSKLVIQ